MMITTKNLDFFSLIKQFFNNLKFKSLLLIKQFKYLNFFVIIKINEKNIINFIYCYYSLWNRNLVYNHKFSQ